jgi:hypothetical protein
MEFVKNIVEIGLECCKTVKLAHKTAFSVIKNLSLTIPLKNAT